MLHGRAAVRLPVSLAPQLRRILFRLQEEVFTMNYIASERVEHLFMLYEKMHAPLAIVAKPKGRRSRRMAGGSRGKAAS